MFRIIRTVDKVDLIDQSLNKFFNQGYNTKDEAEKALGKVTKLMQRSLKGNFEVLYNKNNFRIVEFDIKKSVSCIIKNDVNKVLVVRYSDNKGKFSFPTIMVDSNSITKDIVSSVLKEHLEITVDKDFIIPVNREYTYYDKCDGYIICEEHLFNIVKYDGDINVDAEGFFWVEPTEIFSHPELYTINSWLMSSKI